MKKTLLSSLEAADPALDNIKPGDIIEFTNDRLTDKGPAEATVIDVWEENDDDEKDGPTLKLNESSDGKGEEYIVDLSDAELEKKVERDDEQTIWIVK